MRSSEPPSSAAEPRRSKRKRSAATEDKAGAVVDLDRGVSGCKRGAGGCLTLEGPGEHVASSAIRNPRRSKRQRRAEQGDGGLKAKGGGNSSGCGCSRKRHLPDQDLYRFAKRKKKVKPSEATASPAIMHKTPPDVKVKSSEATGSPAIMHKAPPDVPPSPHAKSDGGSRDFEFKSNLNLPSQPLPPAMSFAKTNGHPIKNQSSSCSDDDSNAGARKPYPGDDASEEEDLESKCSQVFVKVGGCHVSLQKDLTRTSVKMLVQCACKKVGGNVTDSYCTLSGKCLDDGKMLSYYPIGRNTTINVQHRLRAGSRYQKVKCKTWDEVVVGVYRFHMVALPHSLVDRRTGIATARFLSERIQGFSREVLIALCKIHIRGFCLDGKFRSRHILFHKGIVIFDDAIKEVPFSDEGGRRDYTVVEDIFRPIFYNEAIQQFPLHAEHLLNFLSTCPPVANLRSTAVTTFITNHSALQTYTERISSCDNLDGMAERLYGAALLRFSTMIARPDWLPMENVPAMNTVFNYGAVWDEAAQQLLTTYFDNCRGCSRFAKNFFKHAPTNIHMEVLEAAFSLAMSGQNFLPSMLEELAIIDPPLPAAFDTVKVLGKKVMNS